MGCIASKKAVYEVEDQAFEKFTSKSSENQPTDDESGCCDTSSAPAAHTMLLASCSIDPQTVPRCSGKNSGNLMHLREAVLRSSAGSITASGHLKKNNIGADLHSIIDDQGMLNNLVSRQMSVMSHYSVRSESGSVLISPEVRSSAPFKLLKLIGRGGFGNVYLGQMPDGEQVAVKIIQGYNNSDSPDEQQWQARKERMAQMEAVLMSAIEHDNIVRTFKVTATQGEDAVDPEMAHLERQLLNNYVGPGCNKSDDEGLPSFEWHIVMEYCDRGSLSQALSSFMLHQPSDAQHVKWDAWASLEILKEVTSSLIFLHEHCILHGDLKAANVLLMGSDHDRRKYISKVSDFGLSRVLKDSKNHIKTQTFGTVTHVPPELLARGTLSQKADVYAIGVLMWEIFTAEKVFKQLSDSEVILAVVTRKARPNFPPDVPPRYKFLAERCWSDMMELRPSLTVVMAELENLQKALCPEGPDSPPMVINVFPARQKALTELIKRKAMHAAQQQQFQAAFLKPQTPSTPLMPVLPGSTACSTAGGGTMSPQAVGDLSSPMCQGQSQASSSAEKNTSGCGKEEGNKENGQPKVNVRPRLASCNGTTQPFSRVQQPPRLRSFSSAANNIAGLRKASLLPLSNLAPQNVGNPSRVKHDYSVQRPAEPRQSRTSSNQCAEASTETGTLSQSGNIQMDSLP